MQSLFPCRAPRPSLRLVRRAALSAFLAWGAGIVPPAVPAAAAQAAAAHYDIPAGPLSTALNQFGQQAGVLVSYTPEQAAGLRSAGIHGRYDPASALRELLEGTGLQAVARTDGGFTLRSQPNPAAAMLEPISIMGVGPVTEGTNSYAARGASLFKGVESLKDIPQSVTVITRRQMDDQRLDTLDEVLANTPGIALNKRVGGGSDIVSRGFGTNTIQYDGIPLPRSYTNGNMLSASSVYLDRVEVLRGAQGLLEGAGSPAGAINMVRKRGLAAAAFTGEARAGSWDNYGTRLDVGGPLNEHGTVRSRAVLDYEDKDSFIDKVWDRNLNAYVALDMDITPDTTLGLGVSHARLNGNSMLYYGLPRYEDGSELPLPRRANLDAEWSEANRRETQVFVDFEHSVNPDWTLKAAGIHIDEDYDANTALSYFRLIPAGGRTMSAPGFAYKFGGKAKGLDLNLTGKLRALGMTHEVVLGGNYSNQDRADAFDEYTNTTVDVFDYNRGVPSLSARPLSRKRDLTSNTTQKGLYGLWRSHLTDRATLMLGGRVSWYRYESKIVNPLNGAIITDVRERESGELTPYGGLVYELTPQWSAYASYAEIFEPQNATDAQLRVLPPMTGVNYEVGIKGELFDGALNTSLAVYRVEQKNRAVTDYGAPMLCNGWYCSRAAGKVRSEGFEIEAHGELVRGLQISAGYTYNRNKYLDDADPALIGTPFNYDTPRHMLRFWTAYQLTGEFSKWNIGAGVNYRSKQSTGDGGMQDPIQGGYAVWNARVGYVFDKNWSAALNVENIFDKRYYSSINNGLHNYVGDPRSFVLTVRGTF